MIRLFVILVLFGSFVSPVNAGIDQEFGGKTYWWTPSYNQFLSHLGLEKSYALVVGVGSYNEPTFDSLPSEEDAIRIKNYLVNKGGFDHVRLITGDEVTREKIHKLMNEFYLSTITNKDRFLFYWSGHGVTAGQLTRKLGYLPVKSSSTNPATMLSMQNIRSWDSQLKAKQTLYLLDSCFSGIAATKAMSPNREQTIDRVNQPSRQILTAGLENQQTFASNDLQGGVFTRALLDGLDGHADTEKGNFKKDGIVTARELESYVRERVDHERRRVGWQSRITPVLYDFRNYEGDFFFVSDKGKLSKNTLIATQPSLLSGVVATGVNIPDKGIPDRSQLTNQELKQIFTDIVKKGSRLSTQRRIEKMADKGSSIAQAFMANYYFYGTPPFGKNISLSKAFASKAIKNGLKEMAEDNNKYAQAVLGRLYFNGVGLDRDVNAGYELYKKSANQGVPLALVALGSIHDNRKDYAKALELYLQAANKGHRRAENNLGRMYFHGLGVKKNPEKAFYWFQKSAQQGDNIAQRNLGGLYANGLGVNKDVSKAFFFYQKSAQQGDAHAQSSLGYRYAVGLGVKKNPKLAVQWYQKSANQGNSNGLYNLADAYEFGVGGLGVNNSKALELYQLAKKNGIQKDVDARIERVQNKL